MSKYTIARIGALSHKQKQWINGIIIILCFSSLISPPAALFTGLLFSILGWKMKELTRYTSKLLQYSIVLMGFGMSLEKVVESSKSGFVITAVSVTFVMLLGLLMGKLFKVEKNTSILISSGTAICGGSAIAAVAPIIKSKDSQTSFALMVVFVLNAAALFIFPYVGHYFNLSQEVFGEWAAIGIHDTSSVVGAGAVYGDTALEVATTIKLIRALWIVPLSFVILLLNKNDEKGKVKLPWFIVYFVIAILIAYFLPDYKETYHHFYWLGRVGLLLALFFIGSNISLQEIRNTGVKSFAMGILLWICISVSSLLFIMYL